MDKLLFWRQGDGRDNLNPKTRVVLPNHMFPPNGTEANKDNPNLKYPANRIRTSKYTLLSFLPKNLLEQFRRFANLYFIAIIILNWGIGAFGREIAPLPVLFVLGVTAVKDLFEDRRRHRSDKRVNNSTCRVWLGTENKFVSIRWKELRVGDVVHLSCNEVIPADILVLRTSDPNGLCYIETMNLDGETNLKQREVVRGFVEKPNLSDVNEFRSKMEIGLPTTKIDVFSGKMIHPNNEQVPLKKENLLLRDCCLKNTEFIEGIVLYAGHETKAMLNNGGPRFKQTGLERLMNLEVLWCVLLLLILCIVGATGYGIWSASFRHVPFLPPADDDDDDSLAHRIYQVFISFLTFIIVLQMMIPLSLYVTIELTKLMQIFHISNDLELFDPETNKRIECRATNIPEDLGQIQYVFSDKTGTLTENKMLFRRCTVGGIDYDHSETISSNQKADGSSIPPILEKSSTLYKLLTDGPHSEQSERIKEFFLILTACNTVVVAKHPPKEEVRHGRNTISERNA